MGYMEASKGARGGDEGVEELDEFLHDAGLKVVRDVARAVFGNAEIEVAKVWEDGR